MAIKKYKDALLKKLTKQILLLQRKEKMARKNLRVALAKAKKAAKTFEKHAKEAKLKVAAVELAVHAHLIKAKKKPKSTKKRK